jgi:hypothetical protein
MSKYEVRLYENIVHTVWVDAENRLDAFGLAEKQYLNGGEDTHLANVEAYDIESEGIARHTTYEIG